MYLTIMRGAYHGNSVLALWGRGTQIPGWPASRDSNRDSQAIRKPRWLAPCERATDYQVTITPFVTFAAVGEQKLGTPPRYHSA